MEAFSVGMSGVPKHTKQVLIALARCSRTSTAAGTAPLSRYKPELLSLRERSVARLAGVVEGDFRDWAAIEAWAKLSCGWRWN